MARTVDGPEVHVALCLVSLHLPAVGSLKEKRMVLRSLKDRLLGKFNISVAEIGMNDKWQAGEIGIATVGNEGRYVQSVLEDVRRFIQSNPAVRIIESDLEII